ncbi:MAG: hypothetical protein O3B65_06975, partial [Chloroflexi bacterium]|nr:hypothetical protein [Chloroflexota bacterium]
MFGTATFVFLRWGVPREYSVRVQNIQAIGKLLRLLHQVGVDGGGQSPPDFSGETASTGLPNAGAVSRLATGRAADASVGRHFSVK